MALVVHPCYVLATASPSLYKSYKAMSEMMTTNALVKIKEAPPYSIELDATKLFGTHFAWQEDR